MRTLLMVAFSLVFAFSAQASWHYNENGGFGAYQPDGWRSEINGRSSRLDGPDERGQSSEIFLGSDWVSRISTLDDLKRYVAKEEGQAPREVKLSGLDGFKVGQSDSGSTYLLRDKNNVIVIHFEIRGSKMQRDEASTVLKSIEVRTKGIEYP